MTNPTDNYSNYSLSPSDLKFNEPDILDFGKTISDLDFSISSDTNYLIPPESLLLSTLPPFDLSGLTDPAWSLGPIVEPGPVLSEFLPLVPDLVLPELPAEPLLVSLDTPVYTVPKDLGPVATDSSVPVVTNADFGEAPNSSSLVLSLDTPVYIVPKDLGPIPIDITAPFVADFDPGVIPDIKLGTTASGPSLSALGLGSYGAPPPEAEEFTIATGVTVKEFTAPPAPAPLLVALDTPLFDPLDGRIDVSSNALPPALNATGPSISANSDYTIRGFEAPGPISSADSSRVSQQSTDVGRINNYGEVVSGNFGLTLADFEKADALKPGSGVLIANWFNDRANDAGKLWNGGVRNVKSTVDTVKYGVDGLRRTYTEPGYDPNMTQFYKDPVGTVTSGTTAIIRNNYVAPGARWVNEATDGTPLQEAGGWVGENYSGTGQSYQQDRRTSDIGSGKASVINGVRVITGGNSGTLYLPNGREFAAGSFTPGQEWKNDAVRAEMGLKPLAVERYERAATLTVSLPPSAGNRSNETTPLKIQYRDATGKITTEGNAASTVIYSENGKSTTFTGSLSNDRIKAELTKPDSVISNFIGNPVNLKPESRPAPPPSLAGVGLAINPDGSLKLPGGYVLPTVGLPGGQPAEANLGTKIAVGFYDSLERIVGITNPAIARLATRLGNYEVAETYGTFNPKRVAFDAGVPTDDPAYRFSKGISKVAVPAAGVFVAAGALPVLLPSALVNSPIVVSATTGLGAVLTHPTVIGLLTLGGVKETIDGVNERNPEKVGAGLTTFGLTAPGALNSIKNARNAPNIPFGSNNDYVRVVDPKPARVDLSVYKDGPTINATSTSVAPGGPIVRPTAPARTPGGSIVPPGPAPAPVKPPSLPGLPLTYEIPFKNIKTGITSPRLVQVQDPNNMPLVNLQDAAAQLQNGNSGSSYGAESIGQIAAGLLKKDVIVTVAPRKNGAIGGAANLTRLGNLPPETLSRMGIVEQPDGTLFSLFDRRVVPAERFELGGVVARPGKTVDGVKVTTAMPGAGTDAARQAINFATNPPKSPTGNELPGLPPTSVLAFTRSWENVVDPKGIYNPENPNGIGGAVLTPQGDVVGIISKTVIEDLRSGKLVLGPTTGMIDWQLRWDPENLAIADGTPVSATPSQTGLTVPRDSEGNPILIYDAPYGTRDAKTLSAELKSFGINVSPNSFRPPPIKSILDVFLPPDSPIVPARQTAPWQTSLGNLAIMDGIKIGNTVYKPQKAPDINAEVPQSSQAVSLPKKPGQSGNDAPQTSDLIETRWEKKGLTTFDPGSSNVGPALDTPKPVRVVPPASDLLVSVITRPVEVFSTNNGYKVAPDGIYKPGRELPQNNLEKLLNIVQDKSNNAGKTIFSLPGDIATALTPARFIAPIDSAISTGTYWVDKAARPIVDTYKTAEGVVFNPWTEAAFMTGLAGTLAGTLANTDPSKIRFAIGEPVANLPVIQKMMNAPVDATFTGVILDPNNPSDNFALLTLRLPSGMQPVSIRKSSIGRMQGVNVAGNGPNGLNEMLMNALFPSTTGETPGMKTNVARGAEITFGGNLGTDTLGFTGILNVTAGNAAFNPFYTTFSKDSKGNILPGLSSAVAASTVGFGGFTGVRLGPIVPALRFASGNDAALATSNTAAAPSLKLGGFRSPAFGFSPAILSNPADTPARKAERANFLNSAALEIYNKVLLPVGEFPANVVGNGSNSTPAPKDTKSP